MPYGSRPRKAVVSEVLRVVGKPVPREDAVASQSAGGSLTGEVGSKGSRLLSRPEARRGPRKGGR